MLEELNKIAYEFLLRAYMLNGEVAPNPVLRTYDIGYKKRHKLWNGYGDRAYIGIVGDEMMYFEYYLDGRHVRTIFDDYGKVIRSEMGDAIIDYTDINDTRSAYPILKQVENLGIDVHSIYVEIPKVSSRDDLRAIREYEIADYNYFGSSNEYVIRLNIKE